MLQPQSARLPPAVATGLLAKRPLAHLLVYALERKLSGTFELVDEGGQRASIFVANGMISRVSTSEPVIYLGHVLYENGVIDGAQLSGSLAEVATSKRLHGQILLGKGMIDRDQLSEALQQQRSRKLQHMFTLSPRTTFSFYADVDLVGERPSEPPRMDPLPAIWRGIRMHPSWDHVRTTIATVGGRRLRVIGSTDRLGFDEKELAAVDRLRKAASTVSDLVICAGLEAPVADLLAYFLVITKLAEVAEQVSVPDLAMPRPRTDPGASRPRTDPGAAVMPSGEYVRRMSFTMRAVGADAHPLRIPSPMPGTLAAVPLPPTSQPDVSSQSDSAETTEAEQSVSEAEMHLVLGNRENAVGLVRKALTAAPGLPSAMALLAYLEALGAGPGQETYLHDLLKMVDTALVKDDACRRGRFYRAEIKKRLADHEGAIRDLRGAIRNDPDDVEAKRELNIYERKVREGTVILRSMSPSGGTPRAGGFVDWLRGKKTE